MALTCDLWLKSSVLYAHSVFHHVFTKPVFSAYCTRKLILSHFKDSTSQGLENKDYIFIGLPVAIKYIPTLKLTCLHHKGDVTKENMRYYKDE